MFKKLDAPTGFTRLSDHGGRGRWADRPSPGAPTGDGSPVAPPGYAFLLGADGANLIGADGLLLIGAV